MGKRRRDRFSKIFGADWFVMAPIPARPFGPCLEALSHHAALDKLLSMMQYPALRVEQAALRQRGILRGIGSPD